MPQVRSKRVAAKPRFRYVQTTVSLDTDTDAALDREADRLKLNRSQVVRLALNAWLSDVGSTSRASRPGSGRSSRAAAPDEDDELEDDELEELEDDELEELER